jgi:hypothetical protein
MSASAESLEWNRVERRRAKRKLVNETLLLSLPGQITPQPCRVRDLAAFGAGLWLDWFALLPTEFELSFDGFRTTFDCRLVWRNGDRGGVEFR